MTGLLTNYLGQGLLADRPAVPEIFVGSLAFYRDESGNVSVWDEDEEVWVDLIPEPEPFPDLSGFVTDAPDDAFLYVRGQKKWVILPAYPEMPDVPVQEAPADGNQYVRKDGGWTAFVLPEIPDAGIPEAPNDGKLYGRKNESWAEISFPADAVGEAPVDGLAYWRKGGAWVAAEKLGAIVPHRYWRLRGTEWAGNNSHMLNDIAWLDDKGDPIPLVGNSPDGGAVFDGNPNSYTQNNNATWVFDTAQGVRGLTLQAYANNDGWWDRTPTGFAIEWSDDGAGWTQAFAVTGQPVFGRGEKRTFNDPVPDRLPLVTYTEEAPDDGKQYARKNKAWAEVVAGGGGANFGLVKLGQVVLGAAAASFDFAGIDQNYEDLLVVVAGKLTGADSDVAIRFNGDSGGNYSSAYWNQYGASGLANTNGIVIASGTVNSIGGIGEVLNYRRPLRRPVVMQNQYNGAGGSSFGNFGGGFWGNEVDPITSLSVYAKTGGTFAAGSVVTLYGRGGPAPIAVEDAPADGKPYIRRDGAWVALTGVPGRYRLRTTAVPAGGYTSVAELRFLNASGVIVPNPAQAFASGSFSGEYLPAKTVDGDNATFWISNSQAAGVTIGYAEQTIFGSADPTGVRIKASPNGGESTRVPLSFVVEKSEDGGSTWTTLWEVAGIPAFGAAEQRDIYPA